MADRDDRANSPRESDPLPRRDEYNRLRAAGILPADIGASWRLEQAGADLKERLVERFAFQREVNPEVVSTKLAPHLILNLGRLAHDMGTSAFRLGLALHDVEDTANPLIPISPFRGVEEVRRDREESDPSRGKSVDGGCDVRLDVEPLCAKMIEQLGILDGSTERAQPLRGPHLMVNDLLDTPIVEGRNGQRMSIREFGVAMAARSRIDRSDEIVDGMFDIISAPFERARETLNLGFEFVGRGDLELGEELIERVPVELRRGLLTGESPDPLLIPTELKRALVSLSELVVAVDDLRGNLDRAETVDLLSETEPYAGRALSGREVAERAIEERVTHDIDVQRRVAERTLYEHIDPGEYERLSPVRREELKREVEHSLVQRVERRRESHAGMQKIGLPSVTKRAAEMLEQASYELRCFRLTKGKL